MKRKIIFTNDVNNEDYREDFNQFCEDNGVENTEENFYDFIDTCVRWDYEDIISMTDKPCNDILVIAYLGLWDGKHTGYKLLTGHKINSIFDVIQGDYFEMYIDENGEIMARDSHHDGTNHYIFREVRENVDITNLLDNLLNDRLTSRQLGACTTKNLTRFFKGL